MKVIDLYTTKTIGLLPYLIKYDEKKFYLQSDDGYISYKTLYDDDLLIFIHDTKQLYETIEILEIKETKNKLDKIVDYIYHYEEKCKELNKKNKPGLNWGVDIVNIIKSEEE